MSQTPSVRNCKILERTVFLFEVNLRLLVNTFAKKSFCSYLLKTALLFNSNSAQKLIIMTHCWCMTLHYPSIASNMYFFFTFFTLPFRADVHEIILNNLLYINKTAFSSLLKPSGANQIIPTTTHNPNCLTIVFTDKRYLLSVIVLANSVTKVVTVSIKNLRCALAVCKQCICIFNVKQRFASFLMKLILNKNWLLKKIILHYFTNLEHITISNITLNNIFSSDYTLKDAITPNTRTWEQLYRNTIHIF